MASQVRISSAHIKESDNGTNLVFTISLDQADASDVTVEVSTVGDTAEAGSDFTAISNQQITIEAGKLSQTIAIPIIGDTIYERTETFFVQLANPSANATIDPNQAEGVGTILNDDAMPTLSIDSVEVSEGDVDKGTSAILTVTRTGKTNEIATFDYTTVDDSAKAGKDYVKSSGTLAFLANETTKKIAIPIISDDLSEANEKLLVKLSGASNAIIDKAEGTVTIIDNDVPPGLSIEGVTIAETAGGTNAVFTVTLSGVSGQTVTVKYATADNTAIAGQDYTTTSGTLTFAPGTTTQQITVPILDDLKFESEESFFVNLSDAVGASITQEKGTGTITDTDPEVKPAISIDDVTITEGDSGTTIARFTVSLSEASSKTISVDYALANDTTSSGDVNPASGTLQFQANETSKEIEIVINGDTDDEADETYFVNLSNPTNADIADGQGKGTITDDDGASLPTLSIDDISLKEGNSSTTAIFTVSLSKASTETVEVKFATSDGTATEANGDYTANSGTLIFNPNDLTKQIEITVNGDQVTEPNETFLVTLSDAVNASLGKSQAQATLENDDAPPTPPKIRISDVRSITEGNDGTRTATFTVLLSSADTQPVTVDYETADGTATTADNDYVSAKDTLTFASGEVRKTITVTINGDTNIETNETLFVNLSNASANAQIDKAQGMGTIVNDDKFPRISIGDITFKEGNSGTTKAVFEVSLDRAYSSPVTVDYTTLDETATAADNDYASASGKLTFAAGQTVQTITVLVNGDTQAEDNKTFLVELSNAINGTIANDRGVATIENDDTDNTPPELPTLSLNNISVQEGNSGVTDAIFTVSLSAASSETVTVNYVTVDDTATAADADYTAVSLDTLTFAPGETTQTITIAVQGDTKVETNETFRLDLLNPQNAEIVRSSGIATLTNDDTPPRPPNNPGGGSDGGSNGGSNGGSDGGSGNPPADSGSQPLNLSGTPNADSLTGGKGNDTIYGLEGDDVIDGGEGHDFIHGGAGNDTLYGSSGVDLLAGKDGGDYLLGGDGDDLLFGGKGRDRLYGENGDDVIYGKRGKDRLSGGEGDDLLIGNLGADRLSGGTGKDQFAFRSSRDKRDRIIDFSVQDDTILIERQIFKAGLKNGTLNAKQFQLGKQAADADDRFIYNRSTGALSFDQDGAGGVAQVQIAQLSKNLNLTYRDIVVVAEL